MGMRSVAGLPGKRGREYEIVVPEFEPAPVPGWFPTERPAQEPVPVPVEEPERVPA